MKTIMAFIMLGIIVSLTWINAFIEVRNAKPRKRKQTVKIYFGTAIVMTLLYLYALF